MNGSARGATAWLPTPAFRVCQQTKQSTNEELATVNVELQTKVVDLSGANNDMNNLLAGTGIATVFLDHQLRVLRFTPTASALINLISSDVGRPFGHILSNLVGYEHMIDDVQGVLNTLIPKTSEVQTRDGNCFTMRILPYRTQENVIEGAVINFVDITDRRAAEQETKKQLADKEVLLQEIHHRIRNNITSIGGLLSTQAQSVTNPEALSILQDAIARVNSMSVLYDNLLIRDEYEASSVKHYVERLIDSVVAVHDNGTGLPEDYDIDRSKGFDHTLVTMLSEQLGGRFSIDSDDGTTSILEFDL
ncbi:MAG: hypothetical protein EA404_11960 [Spirochaetaceae bacterium]|nr:MAG: hypothetical protein EA404_11960 [Spirochaetaceae bacterium]